MKSWHKHPSIKTRRVTVMRIIKLSAGPENRLLADECWKKDQIFVIDKLMICSFFLSTCLLVGEHLTQRFECF
jgi:hypothetical protein